MGTIREKGKEIMDKTKITINNYEEFKQYLRELIEVDFDDAIFGNGFIVINGKRIEFCNVPQKNKQ